MAASNPLGSEAATDVSRRTLGARVGEIHHQTPDPDGRSGVRTLPPPVLLAPLPPRRRGLGDPRRAGHAGLAGGADRGASAWTSRSTSSTSSSSSGPPVASSASPRRCCPGATPSTSSSTRLPATIELSICAMAIAIVFAIPLGYLAAKRHGSTFDNGTIVMSLIGVAVPVFFLAFLLKYWFAIETPHLPGVRPAGLRAGLHPRHRLLRARRAADPRVRLLGRRPAPPRAARRSPWPPSRSP